MHAPVIIVSALSAFIDAFFARKLISSVMNARRSKLSILYFTLLPALIFIASLYISEPYLRLAVFGIEILLLSLLTFNGTFLSKLFSVVLLMSIMLVGDIFVSGLVFITLPNFIMLLERDVCYFLFGVGMFYIYVFIALLVLKRFPKPQNTVLPTNIYLLLVLLPSVIAIAVMFLLNYLRSVNADTPVMYFVPSGLFLLVLIFVISFFRNAVKLREYAVEQAAMQTQLRQFETQYNSIERAYSALREIRHNWRNLLGVARSLADSGDVKSFQSYITDSEKLFSENDYTIYSGNNIIDILLNDLHLRAKQLDIHVSINAKIPVELSINRSDLCAMLSNAFDNAVEAASEVKNHEKSIMVFITQKGIYLHFAVKNSIERIPIQENGKLISSKQNAEFHGFGLRSIQRIVEKYDGNLTVDYTDEYFSLQCILALL